MNELSHSPSTSTLARELARRRITQSAVGQKLGGAQTESLVVQLSAEAIHHTEGQDHSRPDQILSGLASFMMSVSLEGTSGRKKTKKRKLVWTPTARVGQIKEGLSVMGRLKIIDQVEEGPGDSSSFMAVRIQSSGSSTNLSISMGTSNSGGSRIEGGEALHNLMKNGLVADGLQALLDDDKGGNFQSKTRDLTVRTNGTGRQKVLSLTRGGLLNGNTKTLGSFQVLDGKPIMKKPADMSKIYSHFSSGN